MKKERSRSRQNLWKQIRFYILTLLIFLILAISSLHILQNNLLENAQQTGNSLARSLAVEEERSLSTYEALIQIGAHRLERMAADSLSETEIQDRLESFCEDIRQITGNLGEPYVVLNGTLIGTTGRPVKDVSSASWYQQAIAADGAIVYSDLYFNETYNQNVITIAAKSGDGGNAMVFDIFPGEFQHTDHQIALPEGGSYYLCDRNGAMLYAKTELTAGKEEMQAYLNGIIEKIEAGALSSPDSYIVDLNHQNRSVYYSLSENGWYSIVTIPRSTILGDLFQFTIGFSIVFLLFLGFTALMSVRNFLLSQRVERTNDTVRVLGNSYYAIYRVDYETGTYDMIKGSDYLRERLPQKGDYQTFLTVAAAVIEDGAYQEFVKSFSLENIHALVKKRVRDYGGDFLRLFNNEYRWVNVRLLFDESLSQGEVVLCFREVNAEKQAQLHQMRLLENALDNARKNESSQHSFFSSMSHDMRTPLNAIIGLTELAEKSVEDVEKSKEYLGKIKMASRQLLTLINDLLEFSRLERGKLDLNQESFNLKTCVETCVEVFRAQAQLEGKHLRLFFELQNSMVLGDSSRITQIMNNLVSNAVKYTNPGDTITVRVRELGDQRIKKYQFIVSDTGRGMTPAFLEKIFEPYEREIRFGEKNVTGTGLGMPIVKSIVSQLDGQINVESKLGEGSTFTVTLSMETAEEQAAFHKQEDVAASDALDLSGKRILLAEDNDVNMEIATELLLMHDMEVTQAWNGREAVTRFAESSPGYFDAILMDMQMPEMDGCEATRAIRAMNRPDAQSVPILAVTANAFAEDIAATTEAGMDAHISKPIDFAILYQTLSEQMRKKKPRS